jgi:hypothetical protein
MNKDWRNMLLVVSVVLIVLTYGLVVLLRPSFTAQVISDPIAEITDQFSNASFYHWTKMPVAYKFNDPAACGKVEYNRILWAMRQITSETNGTVTFEENNNSAVLFFNCQYKGTGSDSGGLITEAETLPYSLNNKIINASINFYYVSQYAYSAGCNVYPDVEVHEFLHAFGFQHKENPKSIMHPVHVECNTNIDADIIEKLKETYSR